jgi:hypothetical protein
MSEIVELYGGPADGARETLRPGMPPLIVRHIWGAPGDRRAEWIEYHRCPDGVPYEQIAAPDGTQRLMIQKRKETSA